MLLIKKNMQNLWEFFSLEFRITSFYGKHRLFSHEISTNYQK